MATHHGNDGNVPPDGDRSPDPELPELPPEWGEITIPDDPSELAGEAEQVREELLRERRRAAGHPARRATGTGPVGGTEPSIGVPLLIMSVAVLITLVSLFAMAWSGTGTIAPDPAREQPSELPPITLVDATGRLVTLAAQAPVAIMLVEECECSGLVSATAAAAPPGVTLAMIGHTLPEPPTGLAPADPVPLRLADPGGLVRDQLGLDPPGNAATVVLVGPDRQIVHTEPDATSVAQYQAELTGLARR